MGKIKYNARLVAGLSKGELFYLEDANRGWRNLRSVNESNCYQKIGETENYDCVAVKRSNGDIECFSKTELVLTKI